MRQVNVGLRFFAAQKNLTRPTWLPGFVGANLRVRPHCEFIFLNVYTTIQGHYNQAILSHQLYQFVQAVKNPLHTVNKFFHG